MGGDCWKPIDLRLPSPRSAAFFRLRAFACFLLFFLLLRFVIAWSEVDLGPEEDPRDRLDASLISPFDVKELSLLPGLGLKRAGELRSWARKTWAQHQGAGGGRAARPPGLGVEHWRRIRPWLELSSLGDDEEERGSKSSRE